MLPTGASRRSYSQATSEAREGRKKRNETNLIAHKFPFLHLQSHLQMDTARIAELLDPFLGTANDRRLTKGDLEHISTYIDILQRWNARINLTAIRDPEEVVTRHFGESLFAARHLFPNRSVVPGPSTAERSTLADLGSGAGFPGLPLKLWAPPIFLTLIESSQKKATFLREVVRALTLTNVDVQSVRAEAIPQSAFDTVTLRAVESFEKLLPVAARLVAPGGRLALLIGRTQLESAQSLLPEFTWTESEAMPGSRSRVLALGERPR